MTDFAGKRTIKRFRVAREGQTVDGRALSQEQIIDMAETYDPVEYTARINVEHMGGWNFLNNQSIPALGDVIALDAKMETFKINGQSVELMCLYATLSALPQLVEANKNGQKIFTSIEFYPKFADTDRAYLVGLAVTDVPASRGVEPLKFSQDKSKTLATEPQELILMHTQTTEPQATNTPVTMTTQSAEPVNPVPTSSDKPADSATENGFLSKLSNLFKKPAQGMTDAEQKAILVAFGTIDDHLKKQSQFYEELKNQFNSLQAQHNELQQKFDALNTQLSLTPADTTTITPQSGAGYQLTEF